jgi:hypothetical protein
VMCVPREYLQFSCGYRRIVAICDTDIYLWAVEVDEVGGGEVLGEVGRFFRVKGETKRGEARPTDSLSEVRICYGLVVRDALEGR